MKRSKLCVFVGLVTCLLIVGCGSTQKEINSEQQIKDKQNTEQISLTNVDKKMNAETITKSEEQIKIEEALEGYYDKIQLDAIYWEEDESIGTNYKVKVRDNGRCKSLTGNLEHLYGENITFGTYLAVGSYTWVE